MSTTPFVFLQGSPELASDNRKLVRAHVAKYFHPSRRNQPLEDFDMQQELPTTLQSKPQLATNGSGLTTIATETSDKLEIKICPMMISVETDPLVEDGPVLYVGNGNSEAMCRNITGNHSNLQFKDNRDTNVVEPGAVISLLRSGASRGKNMKIEWLYDSGRIAQDVFICMFFGKLKPF
jgi:hypothetical protein